MQAVFRLDYSTSTGFGHLIRCQHIADKLLGNGIKCHFLFKEANVDSLPTNFAHTFQTLCLDRNRPFTPAEDATNTIEALTKLPQVDILIVDHYALDATWENRVRPFVKKLMVIDDLANRPHNCDLILDHNLYPEFDTRYDQLIPKQAIRCLGPKFLMIRDAFYDSGNKEKEWHAPQLRILINFGGTDPEGYTARTLTALLEGGYQFNPIDIVTGGLNPHLQSVQTILTEFNHATLHIQTRDLANLCRNAHIAIGAGGVSAWERCLMGLASIMVITADNQREVIKSIISKNGGWEISKENLESDLQRLLREINSDRNQLRSTSISAKAILPSTPYDFGYLLHLLQGSH